MAHARHRGPLAALLCCVVSLALITIAVYHLAIVGRVDAYGLAAFSTLESSTIHHFDKAVIGTLTPVGFVVLAVAVLVVAACRRQRTLVLVTAAVLALSLLTSQILKALLPPHGGVLAIASVTGRSFPSGHSTAAMTLALCAVLVAPPRWRSATAVVAMSYSLAVSFALLVTKAHFPSDVIAGFVVALVWSLAGAFVLTWRERSVNRASRPHRSRSDSLDLLVALAWLVAACITATAVVVVGNHDLSAVDFAATATAISMLGALSALAVGQFAPSA